LFSGTVVIDCHRNLYGSPLIRLNNLSDGGVLHLHVSNPRQFQVAGVQQRAGAALASRFL
jgi:hypothetical protein